ncbi:TraR/DksA C4-type zinc finger protein [Patescibacteria group bacterium]|nr:TraR/DksA C4-type zinc finger protein [Patescibacteria group bacterium]
MKKLIQFPARILRPLRNYLLAAQKRLERRRHNIVAEDPFSDSSRVNDNAASDTDAAEISGHDRAEALRNEVDRGLITVRKALTKIKLGKYGQCERCKKMIDTDRLAVNPTAELCMSCEKKGKR